MKSQESYSPNTNQHDKQQYEEVIRPKATEAAMDMVMAGMARTILAVNDQSLLARAISTSASKNTHNIVRMVGGEIAYMLRKRLDSKENGSAERVVEASRLNRIGNVALRASTVAFEKTSAYSGKRHQYLSEKLEYLDKRLNNLSGGRLVINSKRHLK